LRFVTDFAETFADLCRLSKVVTCAGPASHLWSWWRICTPSCTPEVCNRILPPNSKRTKVPGSFSSLRTPRIHQNDLISLIISFLQQQHETSKPRFFIGCAVIFPFLKEKSICSLMLKSSRRQGAATASFALLTPVEASFCASQCAHQVLQDFQGAGWQGFQRLCGW